jgi:uncharacterized protein YvpB
MGADAVTIRRRRLRAGAALAAVVVAVVLHAAPGDDPARVTVALAGDALATTAADDPSSLELPPTATVTRGPARITYAIDLEETVRRASQPRDGQEVQAAAQPLTATIDAPVVQQALPNNCETAALEVLLSTVGLETDQLELQAQVRRDGPLDPVGAAPGQTWGDPEIGYVGRADGTGPAGGFGVYQRPIAELAEQHGVQLDDLTGASTQDIYDRVLAGRAVMIWVGLDDGPYGEWISPAGRPVRVNFNEHTVVLTGVRSDGELDVVNVLEGTTETWSRALFEQRFERLGRRALAAAV